VHAPPHEIGAQIIQPEIEAGHAMRCIHHHIHAARAAIATISRTGVTRPVRLETCVTSISFARGLAFSTAS
jgi:hypothetical protein